MTGIVSFGAYIPKYRIDRKLIYKSMGWLNPATFMPGEKAVANFDEDSLTMAAAAAGDCLAGFDRGALAAVFPASGTFPYLERRSAEILATALGAPSQVRTADFSGSGRAGVAALLSALDAVKAGAPGTVLVTASDTRRAKAGSAQEELFGDAAAALLIGEKDLIAEFEGSFSLSQDFPDHWRGAGEAYDHQWEDRFIRDEGYARFILEAFTGLFKKMGIGPGAVQKFVYPCLYAADFQKIAKLAGLTPQQVVEPLLGQVGFTGAADPILHLVKALEESNPGDRIAAAGFGGGAEALLFRVTDRIGEVKKGRRGVSGHLAAKRALTSYEKMAVWQGLLPAEKGIRGEVTAFTALSALWRDRHQILGLTGSRCLACGTPQFPVQRVCAQPGCGAVDQFESYRFAEKIGSLFTFTGDNLAFTPNPPAIYGIVEFDGGGRFWFDITDADLEEVQVGMSVEMSFRRKYVDEKFGIHGYFWKAVPKAN
jgi:3-hydroxy-3-methylglutaryl CoA synthase